MKKITVLTVLLSFIVLTVFCSFALACSGYSNSCDAQQSSYPGDGDDAYANTNGTWCPQSWNNSLSTKLEIKYLDGGTRKTVSWSNSASNADRCEVSGTVTSDTGISAKGTHSNRCNRCNNGQILCSGATSSDTF